jgi:hypothetical protein
MWCYVVEDFGDETLLWQRSRANHEGWLFMFARRGVCRGDKVLHPRVVGAKRELDAKANDKSRITNVQSGGDRMINREAHLVKVVGMCAVALGILGYLHTRFSGIDVQSQQLGERENAKVAPFVDQASRSLVALGNDPLFGCGASTAVMPGGEDTHLNSSG